MGTTNLAIAITFAALFGAAILWAAVYYLHRYIHQKCLRLAHWFHVLVKPAPEDHGQEKAAKCEAAESERGREERRTDGGEREDRREKSRRKVEEWHDSDEIYMSPRQRLRERREWSSEGMSFDAGDGMVLDGGRMLAQPYAPLYVPYVPLTQPFSAQHTFPVAARMAPRLDVSPALPMPVAPAYPQATYFPPCPQSHSEEHAPRSVEHQYEEAYEPSSSSQPPPAPTRIDFIDIRDEYPPIVREHLKRNAPPASEEGSTSSSSSSSAEEIPRTHIPHATQRSAFHFPQHTQMRSRLWNPAPTSYPRQWMNNFEPREAAEYARYAPHMRSHGGRKLRSVPADRRRGLAPSNAPPYPVQLFNEMHYPRPPARGRGGRRAGPWRRPQPERRPRQHADIEVEEVPPTEVAERQPEVGQDRVRQPESPSPIFNGYPIVGGNDQNDAATKPEESAEVRGGSRGSSEPVENLERNEGDEDVDRQSARRRRILGMSPPMPEGQNPDAPMLTGEQCARSSARTGERELRGVMPSGDRGDAYSVK